MQDVLPELVSVSELNRLARGLLERGLPPLWVSGEISNLTVAASGHAYFSLKDKGGQIRAVMFRGRVAGLPFRLREGVQVEAFGQVSLYEARGDYQIQLDRMREAGLGRLFEAFERLKRQLGEEGLFDPARKRPLPAFPRRIGIVSSPSGAALLDVVSTLRRRMPSAHLVLYPTLVQGEAAPAQIVAAITQAALRQEVDVLMVCRGGGSIEDLWAFNEEPVVRAIEACAIPIVSGVGHETDFTLADFAADMRAPTPTAAAELVSPNRAELLRKLALAQTQLRGTLQQRYYDASQRLDWLARQLRHPQQKLDEQKTHLAALQQNLRFAMQNQHRFSAQALAQQQQKLAHLRPDTAAVGRDLAAFQTALQQNWQALFNLRRQGLEKQAALLEAVSPQHILARGFSVVKNSRGQVIRNADSLKQGQKLHIVFAEGETDVRVTREHKQPDLFDYS